MFLPVSFAFDDGDPIHPVALADCVDDVQARHDLPEDRVPTVQVGLRGVGDEKLASVCTGAGIGHGEHAPFMEQWVSFTLVLEAVSGTAPAGAGWIAPLDRRKSGITRRNTTPS